MGVGGRSGERLGEEMPLAEVAAELEQAVGLLGATDALGDRAQLEDLGEIEVLK